MAKQSVVVVSLVTSICLTAMSLHGCTDRTEDSQDPVVEKLRSFQPRSPVDKERIESAISFRQNAVMDAQPILLSAYLRDDADFGDEQLSFALALAFYDEDKDVVGCGIREERATPDGSRQTLVEKYPVFMYYPTDGSLQYRFFPIRIRTSSQQKEDHQWKEYIETNRFDEISTRGMKYFAETLPPVYVSVPEPNHINVMVYLYDRAGHESDPLKLPHVQKR